MNEAVCYNVATECKHTSNCPSATASSAVATIAIRKEGTRNLWKKDFVIFARIKNIPST